MTAKGVVLGFLSSTTVSDDVGLRIIPSFKGPQDSWLISSVVDELIFFSLFAEPLQ
jgi:hypothetical protein